MILGLPSFATRPLALAVVLPAFLALLDQHRLPLVVDAELGDGEEIVFGVCMIADQMLLTLYVGMKLVLAGFHKARVLGTSQYCCLPDREQAEHALYVHPSRA